MYYYYYYQIYVLTSELHIQEKCLSRKLYLNIMTNSTIYKVIFYMIGVYVYTGRQTYTQVDKPIHK